MLKLTTSNNKNIRLRNNLDTIVLDIMFSEIEEYNQYCKTFRAGEPLKIPVPSLSEESISKESISDKDMDDLMKWLESRNGLSNWVGIGGCYSTELSTIESWFNAKNNSDTIQLWFRQYDYDLYEESNNLSINFDNDDGNGSSIISDSEMNELITFFRSLDTLELLET